MLSHLIIWEQLRVDYMGTDQEPFIYIYIRAPEKNLLLRLPLCSIQICLKIDSPLVGFEPGTSPVPNLCTTK